MKLGRKILAVVITVMLLIGMLPTAMATGTTLTAENVAGKWIATGAEMDGMVMDNAMLIEFGLVIELVLNADGSAVLGMSGEYEEGLVWTLDDTGITLVADGEAVLVTFNDKGGLTMDLGGIYLFLEKEGLAGMWVSTSASMAGTVLDQATLESYGMSMEIMLNDDGSASMTAEGEEIAGLVWSADDTSVYLTMEGDTLALSINADGSLAWDMGDEMVINFSKGGAAPAETPVEAPAVSMEGNPVIGEWIDSEGIILTVNADGTCVATDMYGPMEMEWAIEDGVPMITTGYWFGAPMILNADGTLYVSDGIIIDSTFSPYTGGAAPVETPVEAPAVTAEAVTGTWTDGYHTIVINADGTGVHTFPNGDVSNGTWEINENGCVLNGFWMSQYNAIPEADGTLTVTDGGFNEYYMTRETATDAPIEAPAADATPYLGDWVETLSGITMTVNADGTLKVTYPDGEVRDMTWEMTDSAMMITSGNWMGCTAVIEADGSMNIDGGWTIMTRTDAAAPVETPVDAPAAEGEFIYEGTWKACYMSAGPIVGDPRTLFGLYVTLVLNADGTGNIDYPEFTEGVWYDGEYGVKYFGQGGDSADMPMFPLEGGYLKYGNDLAGYIVFSQDETAVWDPSMDIPLVTDAAETPAAPETPAEPANAPMTLEDRLGKKFVATTYTSYGQTGDASILGAEYALTFDESGSCSFVMGGYEVTGLTWGLNKVTIGLTETDAFVFNYGGVVWNAVLTETGFDLDFYGTMTLHLTPVE